VTIEPQHAASKWSVPFFLLGLVMAGLVMTHTFTAFLARSHPDYAVWLGGPGPDGYLRVADEKLNLQPTRVKQSQRPDVAPGDNASPSPEPRAAMPDDPIEEIQRLARQAVERAPLSAEGLRLLGQIAERKGDLSRADLYMTLAFQRSRHDVYPTFWKMHRSMEAGNWPAVVRYGDALMRSFPLTVQNAVPYLARALEFEQSRGELTQLLSSAPPWRASFFRELPRYIADTRLPMDLLTKLKTGPAPATAVEVNHFLQHLLQHQMYDVAYFVFLQFLPSEELARAGLLFNGSFETKPVGLVFDWRLLVGSGSRVEIAPRQDRPNEKALLIEFHSGRVDFAPVEQVTMIPPGPHRFTGTWTGELIARRGLRVRAYCQYPNQSVQIGESSLIVGTAKQWRRFEFNFTVPPACPIQRIQIMLDARTESERLVTGAVWIDELTVERIPSP
jgi:hypothetical protein